MMFSTENKTYKIQLGLMACEQHMRLKAMLKLKADKQYFQ